jgi:energy-coupling factor transporter ATP-binding protein EcfA2
MRSSIVLITGPGATDFTRRRWEELTLQIQSKDIVKDLIARTKGFFAWIERNFVFSVLVDCALAHLIAIGKLVSADIFVFSRAIEDAVDMALMRSRSEAELARMMTQIDNLKEIASVWDNAKSRNLLNCNLPPNQELPTEHGGDPEKSMVVIRNLLYSRGTALVRIDHLELKAGIYALTGGNGSGKSTLFRVIMSCASNERSIDLPSSISLSTPFAPLIEEDDLEREQACEAAEVDSEDSIVDIEESSQVDPEPHPRLSIRMPSSNVVEISQTFYWPLYSKPIDWIYQDHVTETCDEIELQKRVRRVAEELHSLEFAQAPVSSDQEGIESNAEESMAPTADIVSGIMEQLVEEKEDWFDDLSGGQKSKVELVRKVFLQEECPHVLLVDETMAPLDPTSKALVMAKVKAFCSGSVVIVIYHTDVGRELEGEEGEAVECVPSNDFFDGNIHVENKMIHLRSVC